MAPTGDVALVGAPDGSIASKNAGLAPIHAMQVEITQDIVDELLESIQSGQTPQVLFGKAPQLKYGDKSHVLQSNPENHRFELYQPSGPGNDDDDGDDRLKFAGFINHILTVQKAEDVTAGVDSALEQLRSNMAAISEIKEANKTIVGDATPIRTPTYGGHRRFPSTGFKAQHLAPSKVGSPLLSASTSPMHKRAPTSQPSNSRDNVINALRVPVIHLLAREPTTAACLAETCRTSLANVRELLPKIAKRSSQDTEKWQLTDKAFRDLDPYKFPYQTPAERDQAIDAAIRAFDRQRLAKDDKLWQMLLPRSERGQGVCLSRSKVKPPEAKASTPMHKLSDLTKKKPAAKKTEEKVGEKKMKMAKEAEAAKANVNVKVKVKSGVKSAVKVKGELGKAPASTTTTTMTTTSAPSTQQPQQQAQSQAQQHQHQQQPPAAAPAPAPASRYRQQKQKQQPNMSTRPVRPAPAGSSANTKPKNPSPLSASPPLNASDFEDSSHPPSKAAVPVQPPLKRKKAGDAHGSPAAKKPALERSTPSSTASAKRKSDESSSSNTPTAAPKVRKVAHIDTGLASRYHHNNPHASPGASSTSTTSPSVPSLSFRQTVELSQRFQKYYKKYEELYWQLTEADKPPTKAQRDDLWKMHKKLEEMKKEIKAGAIVHR